MDIRPLLIHLESPYASYEATLAPAREVVLAGLRWETNYWPSLAVAWVEQGCSIDDEIHAALASVASNSNFSQNTRHRAFAICKRWERSKNAQA